MIWQFVGSVIAAVIISVAVCALAFRRFIAPDFVEALDAATKAASTLASLGGLKKAEWQSMNEMEKAIGSKLVETKMPELGALKLLLGSELSEEIDTFIQENPDQALSLYEKYRHYLPGAQDARETTMF